MRIHAFVINWLSCFNNVCNIVREISLVPNVRITVLNSDRSCGKEGWISIDPTWRFSRQFFFALDIFLKGNEETMLLILGDVSSKDWSKLIASAIYLKMYKWGVLTPYISGAPWANNYFLYNSSFEKKARNVGCTDGLVLFIDRRVLSMFLDKCGSAFSGNILGWGIDFCLCAITWFIGMNVLQDKSCTVEHKYGSSYSHREAGNQMNASISKIGGDIERYVKAVYARKIDEIKSMKDIWLC